MNINCYAFKSRTECKILDDNSKCGIYCSFRKTEKECAANRKKANDILAALPYETQLYISDKYYNGRHPWLNKQTDPN